MIDHRGHGEHGVTSGLIGFIYALIYAPLCVLCVLCGEKRMKLEIKKVHRTLPGNAALIFKKK